MSYYKSRALKGNTTKTKAPIVKEHNQAWWKLISLLLLLIISTIIASLVPMAQQYPSPLSQTIPSVKSKLIHKP
jgi:hypothetical protein